MVKTHVKIFFLFLPFVLCFLSACNVDFLGLIVSSDLDERLAERDNFRFLSGGQRSFSFGDEYSFIVLADTHIEDGNAFGLEKLADVIAGNGEIKFIVILGDITQYGSEQDVNRFIDISDAFDIPCYPVIGNNDIYFGNWPVWKDLIGSTRYRINGGGTTLFILDSANSFFGMEQLDWLQREIKNTSGRVFVFTHANLFVSNPLDIKQSSDMKERARITSILRDKCDIMFTGHLHRRLINEAGNVQYVSLEDFRSTQGYCLVSVTKTGVAYTFEKL